MLWFMNLQLGFRYNIFCKDEIAWKNVIKTVYGIFVVVQCPFPPSWLRPNIGLLPGVIVPAFSPNYSHISNYNTYFFRN